MNQIYKCEACGNIVEVLHVGGGELVCCGQPMRAVGENTVDASVEKHVPVVEIDGDRVVVKVGSDEHPMTEDHYIEWIEVMTANKVYRKNLAPGNKPVAEFHIREEILETRAYCNLHGLWKN